MNGVAEAIHWLVGPAVGPIPAVAVGALTGVLAVAFTLGGTWALRGRSSLDVPSCRRCAARLRGHGLTLPEACPECGATLAGRRAVRWLRFRRQAATLTITAPVVLFGGIACAFVMASSLVRSASDWFERRDRAAHRDVSGTGASNDATVSTTAIAVQPLSARNLSVAELVARIRNDEPDASEALGVLVQRVCEAASAAEAASGSDWGYQRFLGCRRTIAEPMTWRPAERLSRADVEALQSLACDALDRGRRSVDRLARQSDDRRLYVELGTALVRRGHAPIAWAADVARRAVPVARCAMSPQVAPGAPVGVKVVADDRAPLWGEIRSVESNGVRVVDNTGGPNGQIRYLPATGFDAPRDEGTYDVVVDWVAESDVGRLLGFDLRDEGRSHMRLRVASGPERIPPTTDPMRHPLAMSGGYAALVVARSGQRDLARLTVDTRTGATAMIGRWTVEIDGEWREVGRAGASPDALARLVAPPRAGWGETVRVRFEPASEGQFVQSTVAAGNPIGVGLTRAMDAAWNAPLELELRRADGLAGRRGGDFGYVWPAGTR